MQKQIRNTTFSEQFQNRIEKIVERDKSTHLTHTHTELRILRMCMLYLIINGSVNNLTYLEKKLKTTLNSSKSPIDLN